MNKNRFRVIYSQVRGVFIAVAETVKSRTKVSGQGTLSGEVEVAEAGASTTYKRLNPLNFAVISCLGAVLISMPLNSMADTQIIADHSAPNNQQATILNSGNGLVQVNIQTPSAGGVSRNTYTQFDVGQEGAILNNSRNNAQTQIGGWVQGNPWLAKGEAKVILNEVNSSNPSQLKGYLEVAGKQAQVVIANPSGLVCEGCGVINATRFTLTTGQAVMNQGYLESFRVREGQVTIAGKGLDGSLTPFTDIYSRALTVNAGLYANSLNTVLGQNDINVQDPSIPQVNTATTNLNASNNKPNFALDVGQLGGMYAGKIFLVGTEKGLGVRNAGSINATNQQLTLTANGDLINGGNIIANKDQVQITAQNVNNTGNISSSTSQVTVQSQNLDNSGLISSADELHLQNQNALNNSGKINAARIVLDTSSLKNNGSIEQTGLQALDLKSGQMSNVGGKIGIAKTIDSGTGGTGSGSTGGEGTGPTVPKDPAKDGGSLEVAVPKDTTPKTYDAGYIHVKNNFNNDQGAVVANGAIDLVSQQGLDNQGGELNLGTVVVKGDAFNNNSGKLYGKQSDIAVQTFENKQGLLQSQSTLKVQSQTFDNQAGKINATGNVNIAVAGHLNNQQGQVSSADQLLISSQNLDNSQGDIEAQNLVNITALGQLNNQAGKVISGKLMQLKQQGLDNTQGQIYAEQLQIDNDNHSLNNSKGQIVAAGDVKLKTGDLLNAEQGLLSSQGRLDITSNTLVNQGVIQGQQQLNIENAGQLTQNRGTISSQGHVNIQSQGLESDGQSAIAAGLNSKGEIDPTTAADLHIQTQRALNNHGQLLASQNLQLTGSALDLSQGTIVAKNADITAQTGSIKHQQGRLQAENLKLNAATQGQSLDNQKGVIDAKVLTLNIAQDIDNQAGVIQQTATDDLTISVKGKINNDQGQIQTNAKNLNLNSQTLSSQSGVINHAGAGALVIKNQETLADQAKILTQGDLRLDTGVASFNQGVVSAQHADVRANSLSHISGQMVFTALDGQSIFQIAQHLNNSGGVIQSSHTLQLNAADLDNRKGTIQTVQAKDANNNVDLNIKATSKIQNDQGVLSSAGKLDINNTELSNIKGVISSASDLKLQQQGQLNNREGVIQAQNIAVSAGSIDNQQGKLIAQNGSMQLNTVQAINNGEVVNGQAQAAGVIQAETTLDIQAGGLTNTGLIYAGTNSQLNIQQKLMNVGQIAAAKNTTLTVTDLEQTATGSLLAGLKRDGTLDTSGDLTINASQNIQSAGQWVAAAKLSSTAASQQLDQAIINAKTVDINSLSGEISAEKAKIYAVDQLNLQAKTALTTDGATVSADHLQIQAQDWNNQAGTVQQRGQTAADITLTGQWNNQKGQFDTQASQTNIKAKSIDNQAGLIQGSGQSSALNVQLADGLNNRNGQIKTTAGLKSTSNTLNNEQGTILSLAGLDITAQQLNNQKGQIIDAGNSAAVNQLNIVQNLNNNNGIIQSNASLQLKAGDLSNQAGVIQTLEQSNLNMVVKGLLDNQQGGKIHGNDIALQTGQLNNQQGQISAVNLANIQSQLEINNSQGLIAAQQQLSMSAASINNDAGQIGSVKQGILLTTTQGQLSNKGGKIQAADSITLDVQGLNNNKGLISTAKNADSHILIDSHQQQLNNQDGQINSAGGIKVTAGEVLNQAGLITAQGNVHLVSLGLIDNSQTNIDPSSNLGIKALGNIQLQSQQLNNISGAILSAQSMSLTQQHLNNSLNGVISSGENISIQGLNANSGVNNQGGEISANKDIHIDLGNIASELNNSQNGRIIAGGLLAIRSQSILNSNNKAQASAGLQAKNLQLDVVQLDNRVGQIQAQDRLDIQATGQLDNTQGVISSLGQLNILDTQDQKNLMVFNNEGLIIAGEQDRADAALNIVAKNVSGDGRILSQGDLYLNVQDDYTQQKQGQLQAQNNLNLSSAGKITNLGEIKSNAKLNLKAQSIENAVDASLESQQTELNATQSIVNQGLINGAKTYLTAAQIENQAGRIYGDHIAIEAKKLSNSSKDGQSAVIASRGDIDLGIQVLDNLGNPIHPQDGSQIIAMGDLRFGEQLDANHIATGQATQVNNLSSVINANGNILLNVDEVNNKNIFFTTKTESKKEYLSYYNMYNFSDWRAGKYNPGPESLLTAEMYNQHPEWFSNLTGYGQVTFTHDGATTEQFMSKPEGYFFIVNDHDDSSAGNMYKGYIILNGKLYSTDHYNYYNTTRTTTTQVMDQSAPAMISAGKDLKFNGKINNDKSQIMVGGQLLGDAKSINNADTKGLVTINEQGSLVTHVGSYGGKGHDKIWGDDPVAYNPAPKTGTTDLYIYTDPTKTTPVVAQDQSTGLGSLQLKDTATAQYQQQQHDLTQNTEQNSTQSINSEAQQQQQVTTVDVKQDQAQLDAVQNNQQQKTAQVNAETAAQVNTGTTQAQQLAQKSADITAEGFEIRTIDQNTKLPNNALYKVNPENKLQFLVETDPKFSNYKQWISSDYMLSSLGLDPALQQKRLGDGYYEQRLVQDQIAQLTGHRFLEGHASDDEQYKALMTNGLTFAKNFNLRPGIALTEAQMAQLSSDIVWLVEKTVKLADGTEARVLVPQVYVKSRVGDLKGDGTLISADSIQVKLSDDLTNAGTIAGRKVMDISSKNINNLAGNMRADVVALSTEKDLNNIGGTIQGDKALSLQVKGDLNVRSTAQSTENHVGNSNYSWTGIDRVAGLYVGNKGDAKATDTTLVLNVGGDSNFAAAQIVNQGLGKSVIYNGGDIHVSTLTTEVTNNNVTSSRQYAKDSRTTDVGSQILTQGDLTLAGKNIKVKGSQLASEQGTAVLKATENIDITEGRRQLDQSYQSEQVKKGMFSSSKTSSSGRNQADLAIASSIEGKKVIIDANNVAIRGSDIVSDDLTQITAKENISITAAENHSQLDARSEVSKSGLMSSGGIGFSIGSEKEKTDRTNTKTTASASSVGSLKGDTNIIAGKHYQQTGSYVSATEGDVNILAQSVNIEAAKNQDNSDYRREYEKKGLTIAVNVPVVTAVQSAVNSAQQVGQSKSGRVNAMAAANSGFDAYKAGQSLAQLKDAASSASNLAQNANVSATITYGEQKNIDESHSQSNSASQSKVYAGGKTNIVATGAGEQSNINIIGSDVLGVKGTTLAADHDVNIKAAEQSSSEQSKNSSQGWNAGVAVSYGKDGFAFGVTAGGNVGKGKGNGEDTSYVNSHVGAKDSQTIITSGNATNIIGGQVQGKGVNITAKELNVESLQDTATYKSKQQNVEGQVTVGYGFSASGSFSKSNINANYASVNEQSGVFAGDDGYQIKVEKNTDLKGALITSTQKAEDLGKNRLETGTLTSSDIHNISEYNAKGIGISGGFSVKGDKPNAKEGSEPKTEQTKTGFNKDVTGYNPESTGTHKSVGFGVDSANDKSTTHSGINTKNIIIKDEQAQQQLTGKTAEQTKQDILTQVTTDNAREHSGALANNFDKDKVQKEINTQVEVTKKFGENAPKVVADFAEQQAIKQRLLGNEEEAKKWDEGGAYRVAMHTAIGALSTGSLEGALTTGGVAAAAPKLNEIQASITQKLSETGMNADTAKLIADGGLSLALAGVGTSVGLDVSSTTTAVNVDANNRQLHPDEVDLIELLSEKYAEKKGISIEEAKTLLMRGALYNIDESWNKNYYSKINESEIIKYNQAYRYLLDVTKGDSVNGLHKKIQDEISKSQIQFYYQNQEPNVITMEPVILTAQPTYLGYLTEEEKQKANNYTNVIGKGFTTDYSSDYKNKEIFLSHILAGSSNEQSELYNDHKKFYEDHAAIKNDELGFWREQGSTLVEDSGRIKGFFVGMGKGLAGLWDTGVSLVKGTVEVAQHPIESALNANAKSIITTLNAPEIAKKVYDEAGIAKEKYDALSDLYEMQKDPFAKGAHNAEPIGEFVGGLGLGGLSKKAVKETTKAVDDVISTLDNHLTPKPAVVGVADSGGAIAMTGKPDTVSGIGKTEVATGAVAVGSGEKTSTNANAQNSRDEYTKPYDPKETRKDLEAVHGKENVKSTTVVNDPYQRVNSNPEKGIEVVYDSYGNKAVKAEYYDPLTKEIKHANIAYDSRGLPVFDNYSKYTTKIDMSLTYERQMAQATRDLRMAINSGRVKASDFTPQQLKQIQAGSAQIDGYTWHHNAQSSPNNFLLLPKGVHDAALHIGQGSLSGGK